MQDAVRSSNTMYSHLARHKHSSAATIKSFNELFSPKAFPIIGHAHLFIPKIGKYSADRFTDSLYSIMKNHQVSVMKLMLKGQPMVFTISPEDTRTMYQNEGKYPLRSSMDALKIIRERNGQSVGVIASNGESWSKLRPGVNLLLKRPLVSAYHEKHRSIAKLHVVAIGGEVSRDNEQVLRDVTAHCTRYTLDAISVISPVIDVSNEEDKKNVLEQNTNILRALYKTMGEPPCIYKLIKTEAYRSLESATNYFYNKIKANIKNMDLSQEPFLKSLFELGNLSYKDKVMTAMDIFLGGIDATATTIAMTLHYLSMDRALQDLIVQEVSTTDSNNYRLLKACIKETLRIASPAGGNGRYIQNDVVIGGYRVPKGCSVLSLNPIIGLLEEHFPSPLQYIPQRWLRSNKTRQNTSCPNSVGKESTHLSSTDHKAHPFAALPFGFGPRMCPGKFIAEQEMVLFLAEVLKKFTLHSVDTEPLGMVFRTNRVPDRQINIKFMRR